MKLEKSRICLDCEEVFEDNEQQLCPKCESCATASLMLWVVPLAAIWGPDRMVKAVNGGAEC